MTDDSARPRIDKADGIRSQSEDLRVSIRVRPPHRHRCAEHDDRRDQERGRHEKTPVVELPARERLPLDRRGGGLGELAAGCISLVRRFCERSREDNVERFGKVRPDVGESRRRLVQVCEDDRELALTVERPLPARHS